MSEELTLLPCPACGASDVVMRVDTRAYGFCPACGMCGPCAPKVDTEYVVRQWNARPRAMMWTNALPKVPGWYWHRCEEDVVTIRRLWKGDIEVLSKIPQQWAGPIPEPSEPK